MSNDIDTAAIESLRTFAEQHGELAFAHLCTAALQALKGDESEAWAVERFNGAQREVNEMISRTGGMTDERIDYLTLKIIRTIDCTRPDGAIARSFQP